MPQRSSRFSRRLRGRRRNFDGPLGVLAGVEVAQTMEERGIETVCLVEVVAFTDEEGARFSFGMVGSRALAGSLSSEDLEQEDGDEVPIADAMRERGLDPDKIAVAARKAPWRPTWSRT